MSPRGGIGGGRKTAVVGAASDLPADPLSPRQARRIVTQVLHEWKLDDVVEVAELLTSEIVTNALLHAGSAVRLVICLDDNVLRVEAHDASARAPVVRTPDSEANAGRGLAMVEALAEEWGARQETTGKVVWFSVRV